MDDLEKHIQQIMQYENNKGLQEFDGYSPNEMDYLLYNPFAENSPITLLKGSDADYDKIPILTLVKYILNLINEKESIKLTQAGYLPVKLVVELHEKNFRNVDFSAYPEFKVRKETDSFFVHVAMILINIARLIKKRNVTLTLLKYIKVRTGRKKRRLLKSRTSLID